MIMIVGDTRSRKYVEVLQELGWGRMVINKAIRPYEGEPWGFDNGAFRDHLRGKPFDESAFLRRLDKAYSLGTPYLAVAPDIVCGGAKSLEFSLKWLDRLPGDWPWYLAVQDGMKIADVEPVLPRFAGIFLGGSDAFKNTAYHWKELAHRYGKRFHYARAGTGRKIARAARVGADSCDSAFPLWIAQRLRKFVNSFKNPYLEPELWPEELIASAP